MKTKLTLSVDDSVVAQAKGLAARNGTSVSHLFTDFVRREAEADGPTFSQRWRGRFADIRNPNGERLRHLERKLG